MYVVLETIYFSIRYIYLTNLTNTDVDINI